MPKLGVMAISTSSKSSKSPVQVEIQHFFMARAGTIIPLKLRKKLAISSEKNNHFSFSQERRPVRSWMSSGWDGTPSLTPHLSP